MASKEHKQLAMIIKNVHQELRMNAKKVGASQAWKDHLQQQEILQRYADAMHQLATNHWENNSDEKTNSRIQWVVEQCLNYFMKGGQEIQNYKEMRRLQNLHEHEISNCEFCVNCSVYKSASKFLLLDVGSCYNPFKKYSFFEVFPIDLKPACSDVFEADFLNLSISCEGMTSEEMTKVLPVRCIPANHFDIVVFSLLLEYMPSCQQRFACCEKAFHVLKPGGLLFIISPDSKHVGANAPLMRKWRICLAQIGFTRIVYEKLPHIHCMAFRKNFHRAVSQWWAEKNMTQESKSLEVTNYSDLLKIPQDDTDYFSPDIKEQPIRTNEDISVMVDLFQELPQDLSL